MGKKTIVFIVISISVALLMAYSVMRWRGERYGKADLSEIEALNKNLTKVKVKLFGWVTLSSSSIEAFYAHHDKFTWVSPTWYYITGGGYLIDRGVSRDFIEKCRSWGVKLIPLVANWEFDRDTIHRILTNPEVRKKAVDSIVEEVLRQGYDGINIDFENIPYSDRGYLTEFMRLLYEKLHSHGKIVTQAVGLSYVYDHKALAEYNDYLIVMAYGYHYSGSGPGPIAPLYWLEDVIRNMLKYVPREKLIIGVPLYGYDWPKGGRGSAVTYYDAISLAGAYGAKVRFDNASGEAYFRYSSGGLEHEVWFQVAKSFEVRAKLIKAFGLDKIAVWRVGQEDPLIWDIIIRPENKK